VVDSLASAVPGILATAEANALASGALSLDEEKLIQDATCLREAKQVLDASKEAKDETKKPPAVGLFSELVKGVVSGQSPDVVGVQTKRTGLQN
jgi:hypothetical protein